MQLSQTQKTVLVPAVLALLIAGMVWFGYDGWINQDPSMLEHQTFNRVGFVLLTIGAAWFGYKGWHEWQDDRAARNQGTDDHSA